MSCVQLKPQYLIFLIRHHQIYSFLREGSSLFFSRDGFSAKKNIREELEEGGNRVRFFTPFIVIVKFAAPVAIAAVFLNSTGLIKF